MLNALFSRKNKKEEENTKKARVHEEKPKKNLNQSLNHLAKHPPNHLRLGAEGEEKAWEFLREKGFVLLEKNWRSHPHEIDLICMHLDTIVFIEVKSRKSYNAQDSIAAFTLAKQENIVNAAKKYLTQKQLWHKPCRFDFICIYHEHQNVEHFENVIEHEDSTPYASSSRGRKFGAQRKKRHSLHNSNTTWQPW